MQGSTYHRRMGRLELPPTLEITLEEHTTYPALLATETIPVPLDGQSPEQDAQNKAKGSGWPGLLLKLGAVGLGLWLLKRWW